MLKRIVARYTKRILFPPSFVQYSSQTIYEALHGVLRLVRVTDNVIWSKRAAYLQKILAQIQQPDGGFDIGYNFNYCYHHRKGESTSPELRALMCQREYAQLFGAKEVFPMALQAAAWIKRYSFPVADGKIAIPYGPYSSPKVVNYNAVSFATGAVAALLDILCNDMELQNIYRGYVAYLYDVTSRKESLPGCFWFYSDQNDFELTEFQRRKIDYYHLMQQVEVHALAQQWRPLDLQKKLLRNVLVHILAFSRDKVVMPYCQNSSYFGDMIHVWGLCSLASGCLEASKICPDLAVSARALAVKTLYWILHYSWNGKYFYPVISKDGRPVERSYMIRSDAWVFNAFAAARLHLGEGPWDEVIELCWQRMEKFDFSGPESHAIHPRHTKLNHFIRLLRNPLF